MASSSTRSPFLIRPSRIAASSAKGIEAGTGRPMTSVAAEDNDVVSAPTELRLCSNQAMSWSSTNARRELLARPTECEFDEVGCTMLTSEMYTKNMA